MLLGCQFEAPKEYNLYTAQERVMQRKGRIPVMGRYVRLPKRLEDDWHLEGHVLGEGASGQVVSAMSLINPQQRAAIKSFDLLHIGAEQKALLTNEMEIFLSLDHPHMARLMAVYESKDKLSLVMECMEGGELFDRVSRQKIFTESCAACAANQMFHAVEYVHRQGIVHRDLKLENFVYESPGSDFLKLIDFGYSKFYTRRSMKEALGTLPYAAPEVLKQKYNAGSCDMWSLGVVVFILLSGYMPFNDADDEETKLAVMKCKYIMHQERWGHVSEDAKHFVRRLLVVDPSDRLTAKQALDHPWLKAVQNKKAYALSTEAIARGFLCFARATRFQKACLRAMAWNTSSQERRQLRDAFLELSDAQGGTVCVSEIEAIVKKHFDCNGKTQEVILALQDFDINKSGRIHYSDFLAAMMAIEQRTSTVASTFRQFDVSGQGVLETADLGAVLGPGYSSSGIFREVGCEKNGSMTLQEFSTHLSRVGTSYLVDSFPDSSFDCTKPSNICRFRTKLMSIFHSAAKWPTAFTSNTV